MRVGLGSDRLGISKLKGTYPKNLTELEKMIFLRFLDLFKKQIIDM
jgi:hypothetical protein